jgi:hypothetical protein
MLCQAVAQAARGIRPEAAATHHLLQSAASVTQQHHHSGSTATLTSEATAAYQGANATGGHIIEYADVRAVAHKHRPVLVFSLVRHGARSTA